MSTEVTIGTQVWITKNLDVSYFRNGDPIPHAKTDEEWIRAGEAQRPAWCYYENDQANGAKYGKLYNWYAANDKRGLAPVGYHIPTSEEWNMLTDYLGGESKAGAKMKSKNGWYNNGNGTNSNGFSALPGGCRSDDGSFNSIGLYSAWWCFTGNLTDVGGGLTLNYANSGVLRAHWSSGSGFFVRCLRD